MSASVLDVVEAPLGNKRGLVKFVKFGSVGLSGVIVNTVALAVASSVLHLHYLIGSVLATQASTTWNYVLLDVLIFKSEAPRGGSLRRYLRFSGLNHAAIVVRGPLLVILTEILSIHYLVSNGIVLFLLVLFRYRVSDRLIWGSPTAATAGAVPRRRFAPPPRLVQELDRSPVSWPVRIAAVAAVGGPALLLRVWQLGAVGINSDEAVYAGQAASIAGDKTLQPFFPIFRAHPLLFQATLSVVYQFGTSPLAGRVLSALFGLATVALCYLVGRELYSRQVGVVAALLLGVMPYHVVVTRQVLLDGPMTFFATLSLFLLARFARTNNSTWLVALGAALGLTFISKETSIILFGCVFGFLATSSSVRLNMRAMLLSSGAFVAFCLPFPLAVKFSGKTRTGGSFLVWQLFRRPNHPWTFYATAVPAQIGAAVLVVAVAGLVLLWRKRSWRESLLLWWTAVPVVFFQLWSVKGFQYLLPIAPAVAVLAARGLVGIPAALRARRPRAVAAVRVVMIGVCALSLFAPSWSKIAPGADSTGLAGAGGVPGGRETGQWLAANAPEGSKVLTIGPSMANILQFYGGHKSLGLSVSTNPLYRNPVYEPVVNPDLQLRNSEFQYVVWDRYSADRSPHFGDRLEDLAKRFHGRVVHTESVTVGGVSHPVVVVYEVRA